MGNGADEKREWGLFDPGNVGAYPGRVIPVRPGMLEENILDVRGTDDRGVTLTTIVLSRTLQRPEVDTFRSIFANINYGVGGGRGSVIVDWLHGQCITVPGSFMRINATYPIDNVNPPGWPPVLPEPETFGIPTSEYADATQNAAEAVLVGVNIAPQPHPQAAFGSTPRLTIFVELPASPQGELLPSAFIRVPPHAQSVTVLSNSNIFVPDLISFHSIQSTTASLYADDNFQPNFDVEAIPIGRGVEWILLWTTDEAERLVQLLFTIGL